MKFHLASELQRRLMTNPPSGWIVRREAGLLSSDFTRVLGYRPTVDLLLESESAAERIWVEFEVSRADPVANHTKFASAHLIDPLPKTDAFVSLVSNDVATGRANLAAHAVFLLRLAGLRAFQMPLLPTVDANTIKQLNQGRLSFDDLPDVGIQEVIDLTRPLGEAEANGTGIYYATNRLEVMLNLHQWNRDIWNPEHRIKWGKRNVRYFVADILTGLFAPSKFCAYTRMPPDNRIAGGDTPGMSIPSYVRIEHSNRIFDGQKGRVRLQGIGFLQTPLSEAPAKLRKAFMNWMHANRTSLNVSLETCAVLYPSSPTSPWSRGS